jgi:hypothetical protein
VEGRTLRRRWAVVGGKWGRKSGGEVFRGEHDFLRITTNSPWLGTSWVSVGGVGSGSSFSCWTQRGDWVVCRSGSYSRRPQVDPLPVGPRGVLKGILVPRLQCHLVGAVLRRASVWPACSSRWEGATDPTFALRKRARFSLYANPAYGLWLRNSSSRSCCVRAILCVKRCGVFMGYSLGRRGLILKIRSRSSSTVPCLITSAGTLYA